MSEFAAEAVTKLYGSVRVLSDASVALERGRFHGLVGPNGSGKTTLLHVLSGLVRPTSGRVVRPSGAIGIGFQEPRFYPDLTVRENLSVFRSFDDDPPPANWTQTLLSELHLEPAAHQKGRALSGGFRTKLDLALALVKRPTYLLLDEPLADVDDHSRHRIVSFLEGYATDDRAVLVSTHSIEAFEAAFDYLTVLVDGTVALDRPTGSDVLTRYRAALD